MEEKEFMVRQNKVLDVFFKDYFAKSNIQLGYWIATGFMLFFQGILTFVPYQVYVNDDRILIWMSLFLGVAGAVMYVTPYQRCLNEQGMIASISDRLKYLPLSANILKKYRMKKLLTFQSKVYLVMQVGQLFFSIACLHEVVWGNLWYPMVAVFVGPVIFVGILLCVVK